MVKNNILTIQSRILNYDRLVNILLLSKNVEYFFLTNKRLIGEEIDDKIGRIDLKAKLSKEEVERIIKKL